MRSGWMQVVVLVGIWCVGPLARGGEPSIKPENAAATAFASNTLDSGLIAHYPFDKDTADRLGKHQAVNHHATPIAGGRISGALAFDGKSAFVGACNDTGESEPGKHFYQGQLDDLHVWNRALTPHEVAAVWTKVTGRAVDVVEPPRLSQASPAAGPAEATIELKNSHGLRWQVEKRGGRWVLGTLYVHDKPLDAPLASGMLALSNTTSRQVFWPAASEVRQLDGQSVRFTGSEKIGDALFRFEVDVALKERHACCHAHAQLVGRQGP